MRTRPGNHLSQAGVTLARVVGAGMGPFDQVVTSTLPRAFETAIAMGFAVDERLAALASMPDGADEDTEWSAGFPAQSRAFARGGETARSARSLARTFAAIVDAVPEGSAALAISHGGIIEAGAIGCLPDADHAAWGRALDYCEGVRLRYEGGRWTGIELLRLDREKPIDERIVVYR